MITRILAVVGIGLVILGLVSGGVSLWKAGPILRTEVTLVSQASEPKCDLRVIDITIQNQTSRTAQLITLNALC